MHNHILIESYTTEYDATASYICTSPSEIMPRTRSQTKFGFPYATENTIYSHDSAVERPKLATQEAVSRHKDALLPHESHESQSKETKAQRRSFKNTFQTSQSVSSTSSLLHDSRAVASEEEPMRSDRNVGTKSSMTEQWREEAASQDIASESARKKRRKTTQEAEVGERIPLSKGHENYVRQANCTSKPLLVVSSADVENKEPPNASNGSMTDHTFSNIASSSPFVGVNDNLGGKANKNDAILQPARRLAQAPTSRKANVPISQPSKHQVDLAKKAEFRAKYITADPSWIYCCDLPKASDLSNSDRICPSSCMYHIHHLEKEGSCTVGELRSWAAEQDAYDQTESCNCQRPADGSSGSNIIITQAGFDYAKKWRTQMASRLTPKRNIHNETWDRAYRLLDLMHDIYKQFMMELTVDQYRKRPLPLWARIEAMAWIIKLLPREWYELTDRSQLCRRYRTIIMFGSALLSMIDVLRTYKLFGPNSIIRNLDLVLALFVQSTQSISDSQGPFGDDQITQNENGWATVVIKIAKECDVKIKGLEGIEDIIKDRMEKDATLNAKRDEARIAQYTIAKIDNGKVELRHPSPDSLRRIKGREGEPRDGRAIWKPEDDYDSDGIKFWKRWHLSKEYESFHCRGGRSLRATIQTPSGVKINAYDLGS